MSLIIKRVSFNNTKNNEYYNKSMRSEEIT